MTLHRGENGSSLLLPLISIVKRRYEALEWLSSGSFSSRHESIQSLQASNSGVWFLTAPVFLNWVSGDSPAVLICWGIRKDPDCISNSVAGAGKSFLT
jgi:hypothetical protein